MIEELQTLRMQVASLEGQFAAADPDYVPFARLLDVNELSKLAQRAGVIVEFSITPEGTLIFLLGPGEQTITREQIIELPDLTTDSLRAVRRLARSVLSP